MKQNDAAPAGAHWLEKPVFEISGNPFTMIGDEWMLITAGKAKSRAGEDNWNTMTASWGGLGILWGKPAAFIFVRPTRHTFGFIEPDRIFSLSFFDKKYKKALSFCGAHSGKDVNKSSESGLSPVVFPDTSIGFDEAREILTCRKMYYQDLDSHHFMESSIEENYPKKDYHRMYVGEIISYRVRG